MGGGLAGYVFKKTCPGWGGISIAALSAAGCLLFSLSLQNYLPYLLVRLYPLYFNSVLPLPAIHLFMAMLTMFVPTVCMGFLFPALLGAGNGPGPVEGRTVGRYTAVNTLGAIAGVLVSGFVLIPVIGIELTLCITVLLYLLAALTALYVSREPWRKAGFILAPALVGAALFFYPKWEPGLLSSGTFFYSGEFRNVRDFSGFREHTRRYEVLMYKDGASSTVTVLQNRAGIKFLRVNGKTDASNAKKDMATQLLLAYLPMALFPGDPQNALVVGLGSGVSAGALAQMPGMQRVDCVEIEPEVARAASFFSEINHGVLEQPQFNLILTDARHLLTGSKQTYDLIVSEPSNPWMSGIASLYTKEAFELVKSRLSGNGLFCQWIHGYAMSEADFKLVLNTFASVFPDMMLFTPAGSDYLIIGSQRRIETDYKRVGDAIAASPAMARDLRLIGLGHPFAFLAATFIFDDKAAREYAAGAPVHTDDRMTLEFSAPRSLLKNSGLRVEESLRMAKKKLLPERIANFYPNAGQIAGLYNIAGEAAMDLTGSSMAEPFFYKVLGAFPDDAAALTGLGRNAAASGDGFKAEWFFKKATALKTSFAPAYLRLSELYADRGENSKALDCLERGLKRFPGNPELTSALRTKRSLKRSQPPF